MLALAVANGAFRVAILNPRLGEAAGHVVSTLLLCAVIATLTWVTIDWIAPPGARAALAIGIAWTLLTVAFEFGFGHWVGRKPWPELLADYNVVRGRVWILVLIATTLSPWIAARAKHAY